jgi:hypothetical protein
VLVHVGDFFVEESHGGFERFAVLRVRGGLQFVYDAGARELQILFFLLVTNLGVGLIASVRVGLREFCGLNLVCYVFTFPSSGHGSILAQFVTWEGIMTRVLWRFGKTAEFGIFDSAEGN